MSLILHSITDPRDSLSKATRNELLKFARANGVKEVTHDMPALLMKKILREKRLTNISIPPRTLGQIEPSPLSSRAAESAPTIDADDDLMRQFQTSSPAPVHEKVKKRKLFKPRTLAWQSKKVDDMDMFDLRAACTHHAVRMSRKDRMPDLRQKLKNFGLE